VWTIGNSTRLPEKTTLLYHIFTKSCIPYGQSNCPSLMILVDITKFILPQNTKTILHSHVFGVHFDIGTYLPDYGIIIPHFNELSLTYFHILLLTMYKFKWMIS
jgi:hypothetical protein